MRPPRFTIIVVAKDAEVARTIERLFPAGSVQVSRESSIDRVLERFESDPYDMLLITSAAFKAGDIDGVELLEVISAKSPATQILFLAAARDIRIAMAALKAGGYHYARLPIGDEELRLLIETARSRKGGRGESDSEGGKRQVREEGLIGRSPQMQSVYDQIRLAAATDIPVLLSGETGTGKDLAAQEVHRQSGRSGRSSWGANCSDTKRALSPEHNCARASSNRPTEEQSSSMRSARSMRESRSAF
jgi:DNA-binding NtrC family response regulator